MPVLIPIVIILLAIVIVAFMLRQNTQNPYRIVVLGPSGAGKTLFLASMYYQLSMPNATGFFLVTNERKGVPEQVEILRGYHEFLMDQAETDFSAPTNLRDLREWNFTCKVKGADGIHSLMDFSYYDYAGEEINRLYRTQTYTPEFQSVISKADIFLAMLDGQEVLKLMRKEKNNFEQEFVNNILPILTNSAQPVHFIITKWDLLQKQYSLGTVRLCLMESSEKFRNFVDAQRVFGTLRLIPISAVGLNFADLGPDGRMVKRQNAKFEPYKVEMPLVSVIFDRLDYASKKVGFARQGWFKQLTQKGVVGGLIMQLLLFVAWITSAFTVNVGIFALSPAVFMAGIVEHVKGGIPGPKGQSGSGKLVAAKRVIERTAKLLRTLEKEFPESNLTTFKEKAH